MAVQVSYPGVYIDEFAPGAPIEGVGTRTGAFVGAASQGDLRIPIKITSFDAFMAIFGSLPLPGLYLWYAVRGFFQNGGQTCYVVRASDGEYAALVLQNIAGQDMLRVRALDPGVPQPPIQVEIAAAHRLLSANTSLFQPVGNYTVTGLREVKLTNAAEAAQFRPGDWVNLGLTDPRVQVIRVSADTLRFGTDVVAVAGAPAPVRLADAPAGARVLRIQSTVPVPDGGLVSGTLLTFSQGAAPNLVTDSEFVDSVQSEPSPPATPRYTVTLRRGLRNPFSMTLATTVQSEEFNLHVHRGAAVTTYDNLSIDASHPRYFAAITNVPDGLIRTEPIDPPPASLPPGSMPAALAATALAGGQDEHLGILADPQQGAPFYITALDTLTKVGDVNLVAVPDNATAPVQQEIIAHCELMGDRFGVLDARPGLGLFDRPGLPGVDVQRRSVDSTRGYAALYYPWLQVAPAGPGAPIVVPPSGHICGVMARVDGLRGVFKAPANEFVNGATGIQSTGQMSDDEQGQLNLIGINVIRVFQDGGRPTVWGARTTATDRNWQYVNIRRLFLFLEESIQEGIRWAVFEPNNKALWEKLKRTIGAFLLQQWRDGALFGATAQEAYYVRIDDVINPFSEQALGRLHLEIGIRPSYPAEFIIVRIGIWDGGSAVSEG